MDSTIKFNLLAMFCQIEATTSGSIAADNLLAASDTLLGRTVRTTDRKPKVIYSE